jgi:predicted membrane-bound mannosyltransferase
MANLLLINSSAVPPPHTLLSGVGVGVGGGSSSSTTNSNLSLNATAAALGLTATLADSETTTTTTSTPKTKTSTSPFHLLQQQQQISALQQQLMATQSVFNALTPEQRLVAQQFAAETLQFNLLKEFPPNIQVNKCLIFYKSLQI